MKVSLTDVAIISDSVSTLSILTFLAFKQILNTKKNKPSTFVIFCLSLIRIFENGLEEEAEYILFYVTWWVIIFTETIKTSTNMLKGPRAPGIFCLVIMLSMQLSCQINLFLKPMSDMPTAYYCCSGSVQQILLPSVIKQDIS